MMNNLDYIELKAWHQRQRRKTRTGTSPEALHVNSDRLRFEDDEAEALHGVYLPTAEQIHESCLKIQSEWSESERRRRAGLKGTITHSSARLAVPVCWSHRSL